MAYLGPVEFDVFGLHRSHAVAQVMADTDRVWVRLEVVHSYRYVEVGREEEPKPVTGCSIRDVPNARPTYSKACDILKDDCTTAGAISLYLHRFPSPKIFPRSSAKSIDQVAVIR